MSDLTAKRCRALLDSARSDEPNADSLQRTAAALGLPAAVVSGATTLSTSSSAAGHLSAAKAAGAAASKTAAVVTTAKTTGGLSLAALGATSVTTKFVSAVVLAAGGIVGVAEWQGAALSLREADKVHDPANAGVDPRTNGAAGTPQHEPVPFTPRLAPSEASTIAANSAPSAAPTQVESGQSRDKPVAPRTMTTSAKSSVVRPDRERPNPNTLDLELAHLAKARTALMASRPDEALRWLDDYDKRYGAGVLLQEANVLRERAREAKAKAKARKP